MDNEKIDKIISMLQELKEEKKHIIHYVVFTDTTIRFNTWGGTTVTYNDINQELWRENLDKHDFADKVEIYVGFDTPLTNVRRLLNYFLIKGYSMQIPDQLSSKVFIMVK